MERTTRRQGSDVRVTVIVPAFQEARRLESSLRTIAHFLEAKPGGGEIIVVDDGSTDGTSLVAQRIAGELEVPVRTIRYELNRGKGFALKVGFAHALGSFVLFTDADLSAPIEEADRILDELEASDIVIGSRKMVGSEIDVHQSWLREGMGWMFTRLVRWFLVDVSDVTCGLKGFRSEAGRDLFARTRIHDWSFDAEVLFLAVRRGYQIREVPVRWSDHDDTKVHIASDALASLWGLLRIRWYAARGLYRSHAVISEQWTDWRSPAHVQLEPGRAS
jgi:dolichyl-phosphate beta-glucosyltransferase